RVGLGVAPVAAGHPLGAVSGPDDELAGALIAAPAPRRPGPGRVAAGVGGAGGRAPAPPGGGAAGGQHRPGGAGRGGRIPGARAPGARWAGPQRATASSTSARAPCRAPAEGAAPPVVSFAESSSSLPGRPPPSAGRSTGAGGAGGEEGESDGPIGGLGDSQTPR